MFAGSYLHRAGLETDEDPFVLFQIWGSGMCEPQCVAEQAKHPEVEWTPVPRSEWYARVEAQEAAREAAEA